MSESDEAEDRGEPEGVGCPECGEELILRGSFCRACGWERELAEAELSEPPAGYAGEDDDHDYEDLLAAEGLGGRGGDGVPWGRLLVVLIGIALVAWIFVLGGP